MSSNRPLIHIVAHLCHLFYQNHFTQHFNDIIYFIRWHFTLSHTVQNIFYCVSVLLKLRAELFSDSFICGLQVTSFEPYMSRRRTVRWTPCVSRHQSWLTIKLTFACVASCYSARLSTLSGQFWPKQLCMYVCICSWLMGLYGWVQVHVHAPPWQQREKKQVQGKTDIQYTLYTVYAILTYTNIFIYIKITFKTSHTHLWIGFL